MAESDHQATPSSGTGVDACLARHGGLSYLEIPALEPLRSAAQESRLFVVFAAHVGAKVRFVVEVENDREIHVLEVGRFDAELCVLKYEAIGWRNA